jgi:hypothetical protein
LKQTTAQATSTNANHRPESLSHRTCNRRQQLSHDSDRSTFHRCRPSRVSALVSASARLGLGRLYAQSDFGSLPPRSRDEVRASVATASMLRSTIDEYVQASASTEQAAALGDFADKPLIVLTAGSGDDAAWSAAQNRMATLSTNSVHRIIDGATHEDLITDEEDAAATTQAILDVVASVRSKGALVR